MSATVFLARHARHDEVGTVLSGRSDIALNPAGIAEATRLAARLADVPLTAVCSSPRRRAWQTAEIVAARHRLPVTVADGLDEIDFGAWTGRSFAELGDDPAWHTWNAARGQAATPSSATMASATARAVAVVAAADDGQMLCVSHCDIIRGVVAHYLGLDADRVLAFDVDPGSLTTLAVDAGAVRVVSVNERPR